ncbi:glycoside hydrolase family 16 protein, partial [Mycena olivaceomarginata]
MIPSLDGYTVVWSDDFDGAHGAGIDHNKWNQKTGPGPSGNHEWQLYTAGTENVHLSGDGQLYIVPTHSGNQWYSGRLESKTSQVCDNGHAMIFQAELWAPNFTGSPAKFAGLWPAFWALGEDLRSGGVSWPRCGEWDIFEVTNNLSDQNKATLHYENPPNSGKDDPHFGGFVHYEGGQYHTWALKVDRRPKDWRSQSLTWYLDGKEFYSVNGAAIGDMHWIQVACRPYFIIFNMAVGGDYPGNPTSQTVSGFNASLRVKYAAIYKS